MKKRLQQSKLKGTKRQSLIVKLNCLTVSTLIIAGLTCDSLGQKPSWTFSQEQFEGHIGVILPAGSSVPIGSGFAFGTHKDVVTCAHVVLAQTNYVFGASNPVTRQLQLKYILPRYDLAVFSATPAIPGASFKVGDFKKLRPGDTVIYFGWDVRRMASVVNTATVSAIGSALNDGVIIDFIEFEGVGIPGYSGGAVFNDKTELVGIMREAWTKKGVKGGNEILINRAFSLEILSILDSQVFQRIEFSGPATNKSSITLSDVLEFRRLMESKTNTHPQK